MLADDKVPPVRVETETRPVVEDLSLSREILEMCFERGKPIACNDLRKVKVAFRILRAAYQTLCEQSAAVGGYSAHELERQFIIAGGRRIMDEKNVIMQTTTFISNPLDKKS